MAFAARWLRLRTVAGRIMALAVMTGQLVFGQGVITAKLPTMTKSVRSPSLGEAPDASARSLFAQIESDLRQRIISNRLLPGSKLPSEAALEQQFGVSRITIRQALAALHSSGLIQKVNGKGSFVTRPADAPRLGPLTGFYDHMRALGHQAHGRLVSVRKVRATAVHARALAIAVGTPLTAVSMVRLVDGKPLAVGAAFGPDALMQALVREDVETNDMMTLLESRMGYRLKNTHIETSAIRAGKLRARQLRLQENDPVLHICFTPHDMSDRPLTYSEMFFRGDAFRYKAVVKR